uniref:Uncharacterized protein n=1 Tax=Knipowitschia caucasica TaxID=637954 RepID=A0AAV2MJ06_KNICA
MPSAAKHAYQHKRVPCYHRPPQTIEHAPGSPQNPRPKSAAAPRPCHKSLDPSPHRSNRHRRPRVSKRSRTNVHSIGGEVHRRKIQTSPVSGQS